MMLMGLDKANVLLDKWFFTFPNYPWADNFPYSVEAEVCKVSPPLEDSDEGWVESVQIFHMYDQPLPDHLVEDICDAQLDTVDEELIREAKNIWRNEQKQL